MRGRIARKTGGVVAKNSAPTDIYAGAGSPTAKAAVKRKAGGKTMGNYDGDKPKMDMKRKAGGKTMGNCDGDKPKMDMGRKPRKSGGRLGGTDWTAAQKGTAPAGRKMDMDVN